MHSVNCNIVLDFNQNRCKTQNQEYAQNELILLPIFFPQSVLWLALLMWLNAFGVIPGWQTAMVAHAVFGEI